jgi:sugar phosphate isomerase/epimerase
MRLEFVDLTLEPPAAAWHRVNPARIRDVLDEHGLEAVGHTAYYLPVANPFESLRRAAVEELKRCLETFSHMGIKWMNIHPDRNSPMHERSFAIARNLLSLRELIGTGSDCGVGVMVENIPGSFNNARQLGELLDPLPEVGLHLDIGHCNLLTEFNTSDEILAAYGSRLKHVHLHDNKGGAADLHLPLGTGTVDLAHHVRRLQSVGYDGTITLEVFSPDRHYLEHSRDLLRRTWDQCVGRKPVAVGHDQHRECAC